jgi:hypothetical protein
MKQQGMHGSSSETPDERRFTFGSTVPIWWSITWRTCAAWILIFIAVGGANIYSAYSSGFWENDRVLDLVQTAPQIHENWMISFLISTVIEIVLGVLVSLWAIRASLNKHKLRRPQKTGGS